MPAHAKPSVWVPLSVRMAVADALHPGETDRLLRKYIPLIGQTLFRRHLLWVDRLGKEEAFQEACIAAVRGITNWLLKNGPLDKSIRDVSTFIINGMKWHFSKSLDWWIGPIRVTGKTYRRNTRKRVRFFPVQAWSGEMTDTTAAVDCEDYVRVTTAKALTVARELDPDEKVVKLLMWHFGLDGSDPISFAEMGRITGVSRKLLQSRVASLLAKVRKELTPAVSCA